MKRIVVGVDNTTSSQEALKWASHKAATENKALIILHALGQPLSSPQLRKDNIVSKAQSFLLREKNTVLESFPSLLVETELSPQAPARALTDWSERAELVVVGGGQRNVFERFFSGSLTYQVAAGSASPVAVIPASPLPTDNGVVVGVDGSPDGMRAVALAAKEADRLNSKLTVIHSWEPQLLYASYVSYGYIDASFLEVSQEEEALVLSESVAGVASDYPDLVIEKLVVQARPAPALMEAAKQAQLLVVGSRGLKGVSRMLLGSTSHALVHQTPCPLIVVRNEEE